MNTKLEGENGKGIAAEHPNPVDRNRSILWARYLVDSENWVTMSTKVTKNADDDKPIVSISVLDSTGKVAYEALIKPEGIVSSEVIQEHHLETSTLFNAQPYPVIRESLVLLLSRKDVYSWDFDVQRKLFESLDKQYNLAPHEWRGNSVSHQYARYLGKTRGEQPGYLMPSLKSSGVSAQAESETVRKLIIKMASTSQYSDPMASGKPGWTAEFYRPKISASEKLKSLFGKR